MEARQIGNACVDCAIVIANGDLTMLDDVHRELAVLQGIEALGGHAVIGDELGFSWSRCACCGTHLGGDRFELAILEPTTTTTTTNYAVGQNTIGYLPDSDPYITSDYQSAKAVLIDELKRLEDFWSYSRESDAEACCNAAEDANLLSEGEEFSFQVGYTAVWLNVTDQPTNDDDN